MTGLLYWLYYMISDNKLKATLHVQSTVFTAVTTCHYQYYVALLLLALSAWTTNLQVQVKITDICNKTSSYECQRQGSPCFVVHKLRHF